MAGLGVGDGQVGGGAGLALGRLGGHAEDNGGEVVVGGRIEEVAQAGHRFGVLREGVGMGGEGHLLALLAPEVREDGQGLQAQALLDVRHAHEFILHVVEQEHEDHADEGAQQNARAEDDVGIGRIGLFGNKGRADGLDGGGIFIGLQLCHANAGAQVCGLLDLDLAGALELLDGHLGADDVGIQADQAGTQPRGLLHHRLTLALQEVELGLGGGVGALGGLDKLVAIDLFLACFELDVGVVLGQAGEEGLLGHGSFLPALEGGGDLRGARNALGEGAKEGGIFLDGREGNEEFLGRGDLRLQRNGARVERGEARLGVLTLAVEAIDLAALAQF